MLRNIDRFVDLSEIRILLATLYGQQARPSVAVPYWPMRFDQKADYRTLHSTYVWDMVPLIMEEILRWALARLPRGILMAPTIVYRSREQEALLQRLRTVAESDAEILLTGPSGVGKELYAKYVQANSARADRPLVIVNCANLSDDMMEAEMFGHARGAFTGAVASRDGLAAAADGGTLFLDEVEALSLSCQAKVLRFVQLKEYRRLGETRLRRSNFRLITASNSDLRARVAEGSFREDLYFRLRVVPIDIPSLADRPDDVPVLIEHFSVKYAAEYGGEPLVFAVEAARRLREYHWPGNVRELENCVRYLVCLRLGRAVEVADLALCDAPATPPRPTITGPADPDDAPESVDDLLGMPFNEAKSMVVEGFERTYIDSALRGADGNVAKAARNCNKHRRAFFELMRRYGMSARDYRSSDHTRLSDDNPTRSAS